MSVYHANNVQWLNGSMRPVVIYEIRASYEGIQSTHRGRKKALDIFQVRDCEIRHKLRKGKKYIVLLYLQKWA